MTYFKDIRQEIMKSLNHNVTDEKIYMRTRRGLTTIMVLSIILVWGMAGWDTVQASTGFFRNYGNLSWSEEVTRDFDNHTIHPEFRYFFSGPEENPTAIIGINRDISLVSRFWKPVSLTEDRLKNWIWWMNLGYSQKYGSKPQGYKIISPADSQAGVWYSACNWTVIKDTTDGGLAVYTPISGECFSKPFEGTED